MKNNQMIKFMQYINENKDALYLEFQKNEEVQEIVKSEKVNTFFQPILTLEEGSTVTYEILNRTDPSPLFPTTDTFYEIISKSNNTPQVEQFTCNLSLVSYMEQVKESKVHKDTLIFLNIQPQVLGELHKNRKAFPALLSKYHLTAEQIVLELTELDAGINHDQFKLIIDHYREQGFKIALDEAGTGYNSLQTLLHLNPEYIKIDKSMIRNIEKFSEKHYLVELINNFALNRVRR